LIEDKKRIDSLSKAACFEQDTVQSKYQCMGPFSGQRLEVSTGVMDGSRPTTKRSITINTRFMNRWMQATHDRGVAIQQVSSPGLRTTPSTDQQSSLKQNRASDRNSTISDNKKAGRRRNRRKDS
jgi:hypothetical protein